MHYLKSLFDFIFLSVIVKIIIGHWLAERIEDWGRNFVSKNERYLAIFNHYQLNAAGAGHAAKDVLNCVEGRCAIFHQT